MANSAGTRVATISLPVRSVASISSDPMLADLICPSFKYFSKVLYGTRSRGGFSFSHEQEAKPASAKAMQMRRRRDGRLIAFPFDAARFSLLTWPSSQVRALSWIKLRRCWRRICSRFGPTANAGLPCDTPQFAEAICGTIRLKLFKIGALVRISVGRIKIAMASACPFQNEFALVHLRLTAAAR